MPVLFQRIIVRSDLRNNPNVLYLFGDNELRKGMGGQAKEMRGEPNALGIATKAAPDMSASSFWSDDEFASVVGVIRKDLVRAFWHVQSGGVVVIPADGLGTGYAELPTRAPRVFAALEKEIGRLIATDRQCNDNKPDAIKA